MRRRLIAPLALVVVLAGCSSNAGAPAAPTASKPSALSVTGDVAARGYSQTGSDGEACSTLSGYADISSGTQVVITDAAGKTVALGALEEGSFVDASNQCVLPFTVSDVPAGSKFYGIHVGNTNRGTLQYTPAQLKASVHLSIG